MKCTYGIRAVGSGSDEPNWGLQSRSRSDAPPSSFGGAVPCALYGDINDRSSGKPQLRTYGPGAEKFAHGSYVPTRPEDPSGRPMRGLSSPTNLTSTRTLKNPGTVVGSLALDRKCAFGAKIFSDPFLF